MERAKGFQIVIDTKVRFPEKTVDDTVKRLSFPETTWPE